MIEPNLEGEPFPIHGDASQKPWRVTNRSEQAVSLVLDKGQIGPFRYRGILDYRLDDGELSAELAVVNTGDIRLPFGAGFHPWLPRHRDTTFQFGAEGVWLEDERHLPTEHVSIDTRTDWDFRTSSPLPDDWINNAFTGWDGSAEIDQPSLGISIIVKGSPNLGNAILYTPSTDAEFFCFEPVSHPVDAHNMPSFPGLRVLQPGESLAARMTISWRDR